MLAAGCDAAALHLDTVSDWRQPAERAAILREFPLILHALLEGLRGDTLAHGRTVPVDFTDAFWASCSSVCAAVLDGTYRPTMVTSLTALLVSWLKA